MPSRRRGQPARAGQEARPARATSVGAQDHPRGGRVFVLGAGVDVAYGMPTIATLMHELAAFARDEGKAISKALRAKLPHLRFTFDKYAGDQGEMLLQHLFAGAGDIAPRLQSTAEKLAIDPEAGSIAGMIEQLCTMAENNRLHREDLERLAAMAGEPGDVGDAEPLLDPNRIGLSPIPSKALRQAFQQALLRGEQLNREERETLELFVMATSNIEQLLSLYFTQYLTGTPAERKTFLYLAWMLWAFLRWRSIGQPPGTKGIYARLGSLGGAIITFNYTNFFDPVTARRVKFFHGRLDHYLRVDTREMVTDDPMLRTAVDIDGIAEFIGTLRLDIDDMLHMDLPSIVPPVSFKPVMSRSQLRTWNECDRLLGQAELIVVTGYSFATADEHFNDLLRHADPRARVLVVNPTLDGPAAAARRILGLDLTPVTQERLGDLETYRCGRLSCVAAGAEAVDETFLTPVLGPSGRQ